MGRVSGQLKSSANAGQLSKSLLGKVGLKPYYSGAKRMLGVEPIVQSGFSLMPGSIYAGTGASGICNHAVLKISDQLSYTLIVTAGRVDIWRNDRVKVASVTTGAVAAITADMIADLRFYGEANTVGIWHQSLWNGIRLFRDKTNDATWTVSVWPYGDLPDVDLGGTYTKVNDYWSLYIRFTSDTSGLVINVSIDGDQTSAVRLVNSSNAPIAPAAAIAADWHLLATNLRPLIRGLAGMNSDMDIQYDPAQDAAGLRTLNIVFTASLGGAEYEVESQILNTSDASVLASHIEVGETAGEPLVSSTQGGFAGMALYQDRACYFGPKARTAATAMSRIGEYFDLNIKTTQDNGARLEALRTESNEQIQYLLDATYLVAFTNRNVYFASNRTIERNKPLNWVNAIEVGIKPNCPPVKLEGKIYFVASDGGQLYTMEYDAVSELFKPTPVNDLNGSDPNDLVRDLKTMAVQHKTGIMASNRLWMLREDGRLVCGIVNVSQEIPLAACEWPIAGGGFVHGLSVDGQQQVWLTVERNGVIVEEVLQEESENLFQMAFGVTTDLAGQATGLASLNGRPVWAEIDNDIYGPFTVSGGAVQTGVPSRPAKIGLWTAPVFESMPFVQVLQNDDVVRRPGKVWGAQIYVIDTASIAIGANGRPPRDVSLTRASDDLSQKTNYTGHVKVAGLIGACMDPTLTISQVRPGRLHARDYIPGVKL